MTASVLTAARWVEAAMAFGVLALVAALVAAAVHGAPTRRRLIEDRRDHQSIRRHHRWAEAVKG